MPSIGILYYVNSFPKLSESFVLNEITELKRRGHEVAVFAQNDPGEDVVHDELADIDLPVYYAQPSYTELPSILTTTAAQMVRRDPGISSPRAFSLKQIGHSLLLARRCLEAIADLDLEIDVINAHFATPTRAGAIHASNHAGIPFILTSHAYEIFRNPDFEKIRRICHGVDHVVVPSEYNRQYLRNEAAVTNDISVIPATTKTEKFEPSGEPVEDRLLTVARLVEKKGHKYALEAVSQLVAQGYDVEYHIIGQGKLEPQLKQYASDLGISSHVAFLDHVSDETLRNELNEAALFVLPCVIAENGDRDAMPVVLKEAMASETACVSTSVSAIPELITDGEDGLLVPPRDVEQLAAAIQRLLDDPTLRGEIETRGRQTVHETFDIAQSIDDLLAVFRSEI